jgi:hypothetical protein
VWAEQKLIPVANCAQKKEDKEEQGKAEGEEEEQEEQKMMIMMIMIMVKLSGLKKRRHTFTISTGSYAVVWYTKHKTPRSVIMLANQQVPHHT